MKTKRTLWVFTTIFILSSICVSGLGLVWLRQHIFRTGQELSKLESELRLLERKAVAKEAKINELFRPAFLAQSVQSSLVMPEPEAIFVMESQLEGKPEVTHLAMHQTEPFDENRFLSNPFLASLHE